jgi:SAM-dependent methyltransferase
VLEYPLVLVLAAALRPSPAYRRSQPDSWGMLIGLPTLVLLFVAGTWAAGVFPPQLGLRPLLLAFATVLAFAYSAANRTVPVAAMSSLFVLLIVFGRPASAGTVLLAARSFFGVYRVVDAPDHAYHVLQHGSTTHGREQTAAPTACQPTGYYHPSSPIGQLMAANRGHLNDVAIVGLGTGALACYAAAGERWTFYEIDPLVEAIARNPGYFRYLQNSAGHNRVVLGDARLSLEQERPGQFDAIVLDAFSSDAIPTHLLTTEALALYWSRLKPNGVAAFHISNRYLNLEPLLGSLAERSGLVALANTDDRPSDSDAAVGKFPSHWVLMARSSEAFNRLAGSAGWRRPRQLESGRVWTDDYSNILQTVAR